MPSTLKNLKNTDSNNFFLLAGPCAIEGEEMAFEIAERIYEITTRLEIPWIFKGSYRKANRSRLDSFTGIGDEKALKILQKVGQKFNVPVVTDIHTAEEAMLAAKFVDVLQIPAFLCRQTDLLVAAAKTGKHVNIKKGQFLAPQSMQFAVNKVKEMVVDFRGIPTMKRYAPTIMDITHSLQQPNQSSGVTGGQPEMIETIGKAAIASGADGIFIETHHNPAVAKSDGANMLHLDHLEDLLTKLIRVRKAVI